MDELFKDAGTAADEPAELEAETGEGEESEAEWDDPLADDEELRRASISSAPPKTATRG